MMVDQLMVKMTGDASGLVRSTATATKALGGMQAKVTQINASVAAMGRNLTMKATLPIVALAALGTTAFAGFEEGMRNVNSIAKQNEQQFARTSQTVRDMSVEFGKAQNDMTQALYNINSASFIANDGLEVLRASSMASRAGLSSTADAAKAITASLNAYGMAASQATDVSDILFKTVEKGVITFPEIAASLGQTVSTAASAKVPLDQMMAAIATMTRGGINSAEAFTALNRFMMRMITSSPELDAVFQKLGHNSAGAALEVIGLGGAVKAIERETGGGAIAIQELGFKIRDFKAATSLTRNAGKDFAGDLVEQANRGGATLAAFTEQTKALQFSIDQLKSTFREFGIALGEDLRPIVVDLVAGLKKLVGAYSELDKGTRQVIVRTALVVAALGPFLLIGNSVIRMVTGITGAVMKLASSGTFLKIISSLRMIGILGAAAFAGWALGNLIVELSGVRKEIERMEKATAEMEKRTSGKEMLLKVKASDRYRDLLSGTTTMEQLGLGGVNKDSYLKGLENTLGTTAKLIQYQLQRQKDLRTQSDGTRADGTRANPFTKLMKDSVKGMSDSLTVGKLITPIKKALEDTMAGKGSAGSVVSAIKGAMGGLGSEEQVKSFLQGVQGLVGGAFGAIGQNMAAEKVQFAGAAELGSQAALSAVNRHKFGIPKKQEQERIAKANEQQVSLLGEIVSGISDLAFPELAVAEI